MAGEPGVSPVKLEFRGGDRVFVPSDQLHKLSRYVGADASDEFEPSTCDGSQFSAVPLKPQMDCGIMLDGSWQNPFNRFDINGDGVSELVVTNQTGQVRVKGLTGAWVNGFELSADLEVQLGVSAAVAATNLPVYLTIDVEDEDKAARLLDQLRSRIILEGKPVFGLPTEFDAYLIVTTPDGEQIDNDDYEGDSNRSLIETTLPADGMYRVGLRLWEVGLLGPLQEGREDGGALPDRREVRRARVRIDRRSRIALRCW